MKTLFKSVKDFLENSGGFIKGFGKDVAVETVTERVHYGIDDLLKKTKEKSEKLSKERMDYRAYIVHLMGKMQEEQRNVLGKFITSLPEKEEDRLTLALGRFLKTLRQHCIKNLGQKRKFIETQVSELNRICSSEESLRLFWKILDEDPTKAWKEYLDESPVINSAISWLQAERENIRNSQKKTN